MRVHGDKIIRRRTDVQHQSDYKKYMPDLRIDFSRMCGYCGKYELVSHKGMEPDHLVPKKIDPSRECDYTNLVYSCFTCNRKKTGKWPTQDKEKLNDGTNGFADPATQEYDKHLGRSESGAMEYYTSIGKYMYKDVFKFDLRPTQVIWKASLLYQLADKLKETLDQLKPEEKNKYIRITTELIEFQKYLFENKE